MSDLHKPHSGGEGGGAETAPLQFSSDSSKIKANVAAILHTTRSSVSHTLTKGISEVLIGRLKITSE